MEQRNHCNSSSLGFRTTVGVHACQNKSLKMKVIVQKEDWGEKQGFCSIRLDVSYCFSEWTQLSAAASGKQHSWKEVPPCFHI